MAHEAIVVTAEPSGNRRASDRLPGGGYAYTLLDDAVRVEVRYVRREWRQLHAEVDVLCDWAGAQRHNSSLSRADLNLSSQTARKALAKHCAERAHTKPDDFDWMGVIDSTCIEVIAADRAGEAPIILDDAPDLEDRDFEVQGIQIPADSVSMLIAMATVSKHDVAVARDARARGCPMLLLIGNGPASGTSDANGVCSGSSGSTRCTICAVTRRCQSRRIAFAATATSTTSRSSVATASRLLAMASWPMTTPPCGFTASAPTSCRRPSGPPTSPNRPSGRMPRRQSARSDRCFSRICVG